ncbi:hypothetical protein B0H13DRAFT_1866312 [Mycena leptocephala]|nr:hypothetical protein B0H13DRAFT_1866312 [Mycena leptocephala]
MCQILPSLILLSHSACRSAGSNGRMAGFCQQHYPGTARRIVEELAQKCGSVYSQLRKSVALMIDATTYHSYLARGVWEAEREFGEDGANAPQCYRHKKAPTQFYVFLLKFHALTPRFGHLSAMSGVIKSSQLQVNIHVNFSYGTKLARLRDISLASTTNAPAASRKRVNDESAPEDPPTKRSKKSNPRGGVVKKGVEVETQLEVSGGPARIMTMLTWRKLTWHTHKLTLQQVGLFNFNMELDSTSIRHFGSDFLIKKQSVNLSPRTGFVRRANIIMEFHPGNASGGQFCVDNFNGNGNAKPSDGKTLRVSPSTMQCSEGIWSSRGEALGHLVTVGEMSVKGHQHKSIHAQVKQVNPPKFKLRLVHKSICQVNRLSLIRGVVVNAVGCWDAASMTGSEPPDSEGIPQTWTMSASVGISASFAAPPGDETRPSASHMSGPVIEGCYIFMRTLSYV